jgi:hypothetical protein
MSIISDLIITSNTTKNQKTRWRKRGIIPYQVLNTIWWELGVRIDNKSPQSGIRLRRFLELIWQVASSGEDSATRNAALFIYNDTVQYELQPNWKSKLRPKKPRIIWPEKKLK